MRGRGRLGLLVAAMVVCAVAAVADDWPTTEGAHGGGRYSPLADIHRGNVEQLQEVWRYRHGDFRSGFGPSKKSKGTAFESTPILAEGRLIFTTPFNRVIALDPETGRELWTYDPELDQGRQFPNSMINRGVAYWSGEEGLACRSRVFLGTLDARLIAIDASSGRPCPDFGEAGVVDLLSGLFPIHDAWEYNITSPPTVVGDVVVVGSSIADMLRQVAPPGDVRAFDARTGKYLWTFHTAPFAGEPGAETWAPGSHRRTGGANVWSTITADLARGLVFLPVSAANPDFYGGDRHGANLYSDSVVALRAGTGEVVWHFQTVHHDLWDYDLSAPAILVRVPRESGAVDAVAQATKTGFVFLLDRDTGEPLFPVEERPVPQTDVEGEQTWPTQPFPTRPPALVPQHLTDAELWDADPKRLEKCRKKIAKLRNEGIFTPPSERGSVHFPSALGGANWSGGAFDPASGWLFVPVNNLAYIVELRALPHSNHWKSLTRPLQDAMAALRWLARGTGTGLRYFVSPIAGRALLEADDEPCNRPPWGKLVAVDLVAGEIAWSVPVGQREDGVRGQINHGPPLVTAGGLVFHSGTKDRRLRAHDVDTGAVLAEFPMPAGLHAGPITYRARPGGRQLLVVAPGGHIGLDSELGDYIIAYALPDSSSPGAR